MGKLHRQRRRTEKKLAIVIALRYALRENELGELQRRRASKAEIRRRLLEAYQLRQDFESQIIDEACRRAVADIQAEEDARFLEALEAWRPKTIWQHLEDEECRPGGI